MKFVKSICCLVLSMFILTGCSITPTHIELVVTSGDNLNPDINKVSSPLMIFFYELEYADNFTQYDYWILAEDANRNLGNDLISQTKHIITPNQKQTYQILLDERTKYLGIVANFRDIKTSKKWKYLINLETNDYNYEELLIDNYSIKSEE